jgi:hypothetical protein
MAFLCFSRKFINYCSHFYSFTEPQQLLFYTNMKKYIFLGLLNFYSLSFFAQNESPQNDVNQLVDLWHKAASEANFNQYFDLMEDDAIFTDNFLENLKKITDELNDFDMCFISECCNLHISNTDDDRYVYKSDKSRCTSGYILNRKNLKHIINTLPFQYPIDWHLNTINDKIKLKYFWSEPCIIIQGSESIYKSNLR